MSNCCIVEKINYTYSIILIESMDSLHSLSKSNLGPTTGIVLVGVATSNSMFKRNQLLVTEGKIYIN